ncbi:Phosphatidylinositol N-acetylglucosaminyltransferase subunit P [Balamuthia mandrillaris]
MRRRKAGEEERVEQSSQEQKTSVAFVARQEQQGGSFLVPQEDYLERITKQRLVQQAESAPKVSARREVYGFVCWIATFGLWVAYMLWAYLPDEWLHSMGIYYYPSKYWSIAVPAWISLSGVLVFFFYMELTMLDTDDLDKHTTHIDKLSRKGIEGLDQNAILGLHLLCQRDAKLLSKKAKQEHEEKQKQEKKAEVEEDEEDEQGSEEEVPPIADLPIEVVNMFLFDNDRQTTTGTSSRHL